MIQLFSQCFHFRLDHGPVLPIAGLDILNLTAKRSFSCGLHEVLHWRKFTRSITSEERWACVKYTMPERTSLWTPQSLIFSSGATFSSIEVIVLDKLHIAFCESPQSHLYRRHSVRFYCDTTLHIQAGQMWPGPGLQSQQGSKFLPSCKCNAPDAITMVKVRTAMREQRCLKVCIKYQTAIQCIRHLGGHIRKTHLWVWQGDELS